MRKNYLLAAACLLHALSYSQNIIQEGWDFNGNTGNELSVTATIYNVNLESAAIVRGAGLSVISLTNSSKSSLIVDHLANGNYILSWFGNTATFSTWYSKQ